MSKPQSYKEFCKEHNMSSQEGLVFLKGLKRYYDDAHKK